MEARNNKSPDPDPSIPQHIGIIMDGNGRWAHFRKMPRTSGHLEGLKAAKRIIRAAVVRHISFLTLYAFSTENWKRSEQEVSFLMGLISKYIRKEYPFYREQNIRILHTGDRSGLPVNVAAVIDEAAAYTAAHTGLTVCLAINYGGRNEIVRGMEKAFKLHAIADSSAGSDRHALEISFRKFLDNPEIPDPDLIIRTAGERRLSNFLLWQSAYSELFFSDKLWPDWKAGDLDNALVDFRNRKRNYGGIDN
ncbi:MAG: di-trans,poly-cis-decaprenylcistransferase [Spirochaetia bacterium]|nr:di-trans,poly-cis-decaprenylcistransferase [Spirochaetia bacterium]